MTNLISSSKAYGLLGNYAILCLTLKRGVLIFVLFIPYIVALKHQVHEREPLQCRYPCEGKL